MYFMSVNATFAVAARTRKVSRRSCTCPTTGTIFIQHKPLYVRLQYVARKTKTSTNINKQISQQFFHEFTMFVVGLTYQQSNINKMRNHPFNIKSTGCHSQSQKSTIDSTIFQVPVFSDMHHGYTSLHSTHRAHRVYKSY